MAHKNEIAGFIGFGSLTGEKGENINHDKAYLFNFLAEINPDTNFSKNQWIVLTLTPQY